MNRLFSIKSNDNIVYDYLTDDSDIEPGDYFIDTVSNLYGKPILYRVPDYESSLNAITLGFKVTHTNNSSIGLPMFKESDLDNIIYIE